MGCHKWRNNRWSHEPRPWTWFLGTRGTTRSLNDRQKPWERFLTVRTRFKIDKVKLKKTVCFRFLHGRSEQSHYFLLSGCWQKLDARADKRSDVERHQTLKLGFIQGLLSHVSTTIADRTVMCGETKSQLQVVAHVRHSNGFCIVNLKPTTILLTWRALLDPPLLILSNHVFGGHSNPFLDLEGSFVVGTIRRTISGTDQRSRRSAQAFSTPLMGMHS